MVSKASEDFPDPETPVTTVSALCGISKSMFLRLWTRAPRTTILSLGFKSDMKYSPGNALVAPDARGWSRTPAKRSFHDRRPSDDSARAAQSFYYKAGAIKVSAGARVSASWIASCLQPPRR